MKPSYSCKCLKCGKIFSLIPYDIEEKPEDRLSEEQIKKLSRDGCLNCQNKKLEFE
jgi:DNA-directed RNA polymerase subunit RPC12/RpoP